MILVVGVLISTRIALYLAGPLKIIPLIAAILTPFSVEMRRHLLGRRYRKELQGVISDLANIQRAIDCSPPLPDDEE